MKSKQAAPQTIDEYIAACPKDVQPVLEQVRGAIRKAAPAAEEAIKYQIPTFVLDGNLVHFGAFKHHIGFYPTSSGTAKFASELAKYNGSKGTVQFPLDKPMPLGLIGRITRFRVKENRERAAARTKT